MADLTELEEQLYDALESCMQFIIAWEFEYNKPEYRGEEYNSQRIILAEKKRAAQWALAKADEKISK